MKSPFKVKFWMSYLAATILLTVNQCICRAPATGAISSVTIVPNAAFTGADTNTRKFELINKGQAGAGTTVVATLSLTAGKNLVAFDEKTIPLSAVAGALNVVEGDILVLVSSAVGTGIADTGGGACFVTFTRSTT